MNAAAKAIAYAVRTAYTGALRAGASELEAFGIAYEIYARAYPTAPAHRLRREVARMIVAASQGTNEREPGHGKSSACWIGPCAAAILSVL